MPEAVIPVAPVIQTTNARIVPRIGSLWIGTNTKSLSKLAALRMTFSIVHGIGGGMEGYRQIHTLCPATNVLTNARN